MIQPAAGLWAICSLALLVAGRADASPDPLPPRAWQFQLEFRSGYAPPVGEVITGRSLRSVTHVYLPFWLEAGVRLGGHWRVGLYAQFSGLKVMSPAPSLGEEPSSSVHFRDDFLFQVGAAAQLHPILDRFLDPWIGLGVGYERRTDMFGFEVRPELGLNFRAARWLAVGPFVSCSVGRYQWGPKLSTASTAPGVFPPIAEGGVHGWLTYGISATVSF